MKLTTDAQGNFSLGRTFKTVALGLAGITGIAAIPGSFYTVSPSEMANVRRLDHVLHKTPIGEGPHLKLPFVDTVDKIQVSLRTLHIPTFNVPTLDNQEITLNINFNYLVPKDKVNHLLYDVGRSGNVDLDDSIIPVVQDRATRVFSQQNTTTVSRDIETIQAEVEQKVFKAVEQLFGIQPLSLQIAKRDYSPTFKASNDKAVTAKNDTITEQNKTATETAKAAQLVISEKGKADAAIEAATGRAKSAIIAAEADKQKQVLDGQGQGSRLKAEITALGNPENYIKYIEAQAKLKQAEAASKWNVQVLGGSGSSPTVVVPMGGMK